jgi:hypothetical protein
MRFTFELMLICEDRGSLAAAAEALSDDQSVTLTPGSQGAAPSAGGVLKLTFHVLAETGAVAAAHVLELVEQVANKTRFNLEYAISGQIPAAERTSASVV